MDAYPETSTSTGATTAAIAMGSQDHGQDQTSPMVVDQGLGMAGVDVEMPTTTTTTTTTTPSRLLLLSTELQTLIVLHLRAREAIYLSLTCRALHHGVLSAHNHLIWYTVGRFQHTLPGVPAARKAGKRHALRAMREEVRAYRPDGGMAYKKLLVEAMLGNTWMGCQWCLQMPRTRKYYSGWKMRLCDDCFKECSTTKYPLRKLPIDISNLPEQRQARMGGGTVALVWKPTILRLLRAKLGVTCPPLEALLAQAKHEKQISARQRQQDLHVYRNRQRDLIWASIVQQYASTTTPSSNPLLAHIKHLIPPDSLQRTWFQPIPTTLLTDSEAPTPLTGKKLPPNHLSAWLAADPTLTIAQIPRRRYSGGGGGGTDKDKDKDMPAMWIKRHAAARIAMFVRALTERVPPRPWRINGSTSRFAHDPPLQRMLSCVLPHAIARFHEQYSEESRCVFERAARLEREEVPTELELWGEIIPAPVLEKGFLCPAVQCGNPLYRVGADRRGRMEYPAAYADLRGYLAHLAEMHRWVFFEGDLEWLVGRASGAWLSQVGVGGLGRKKGWRAEQRAWLEFWWPEGGWRGPEGQKLLEGGEEEEDEEGVVYEDDVWDQGG